MADNGTRRHYRVELNNLCIQAKWTLHFEDNFTGPNNNGTWTSYAYINDVMYGQGTATTARGAREQASYMALSYYGRA